MLGIGETGLVCKKLTNHSPARRCAPRLRTVASHEGAPPAPASTLTARPCGAFRNAAGWLVCFAHLALRATRASLSISARASPPIRTRGTRRLFSVARTTRQLRTNHAVTTTQCGVVCSSQAQAIWPSRAAHQMHRQCQRPTAFANRVSVWLPLVEKRTRLLEAGAAT